MTSQQSHVIISYYHIIYINLNYFTEANYLNMFWNFQDYLMKSYTHPVNYEMACPLLKDMFDYLDASMEADKEKKE